MPTIHSFTRDLFRKCTTNDTTRLSPSAGDFVFYTDDLDVSPHSTFIDATGTTHRYGDFQGAMALWVAARCGSTAVATHFLDSRENNSRNVFQEVMGRSVLQEAVAHGNRDLVAKLLSVALNIVRSAPEQKIALLNHVEAALHDMHPDLNPAGREQTTRIAAYREVLGGDDICALLFSAVDRVAGIAVERRAGPTFFGLPRPETFYPRQTRPATAAGAATVPTHSAATTTTAGPATAAATHPATRTTMPSARISGEDPTMPQTPSTVGGPDGLDLLDPSTPQSIAYPRGSEIRAAEPTTSEPAAGAGLPPSATQPLTGLVGRLFGLAKKPSGRQ